MRQETAGRTTGGRGCGCPRLSIVWNSHGEGSGVERGWKPDEVQIRMFRGGGEAKSEETFCLREQMKGRYELGQGRDAGEGWNYRSLSDRLVQLEDIHRISANAGAAAALAFPCKSDIPWENYWPRLRPSKALTSHSSAWVTSPVVTDSQCRTVLQPVVYLTVVVCLCRTCWYLCANCTRTFTFNACIPPSAHLGSHPATCEVIQQLLGCRVEVVAAFLIHVLHRSLDPCVRLGCRCWIIYP